VNLKDALRRLAKDGPEQQAIAAGEIDAVIDYAGSNVILLPAARRALAEAPRPASIANRLLAALPHADYRGLAAGLEPLTLKSGRVLCAPGAPIEHVYFPVDCVVSLLAAAQGPRYVEVGLVGYEGMVGISLVLGAEVASIRAVVQAGGTAMRMDSARFHRTLRQCLPLQRELYRYAGEKLALARQTVACNRFHPVEARLACWLLMSGERVRSEEFFLTQAFLAQMLGVRRATIVEAARSLQGRSLLRYSRGTIRILDRKGLEAASCRCYTRIEGQPCRASPRPAPS
jgi:CRP-like cAMP-binding protein